MIATTCRNCGKEVMAGTQFCLHCGAPVAPQAGGQSQFSAVPNTVLPANRKSKSTAGILGLLLGGLGVHKFYLGQTGMGLVYLLFCWTYIPALVGFIEGILFLGMSEEDFFRKYG